MIRLILKFLIITLVAGNKSGRTGIRRQGTTNTWTKTWTVIGIISIEEVNMQSLLYSPVPAENDECVKYVLGRIK